jgi:hypothetical protein
MEIDKYINELLILQNEKHRDEYQIRDIMCNLCEYLIYLDKTEMECFYKHIEQIAKNKKKLQIFHELLQDYKFVKTTEFHFILSQILFG